MNVPAFCLIIRDIPLKDVAVGSIVYDAVNQELSEGEPLFEYEMTGQQMYDHYLSMTPRTRGIIEEMVILNSSQIRALVKEVEAKTVVKLFSKEHEKRVHAFARNAVFGSIILVCYIISTSVFIGYITNLNYKDEAVSSIIFDVFVEVMRETPKIDKQEGNNAY